MKKRDKVTPKWKCNWRGVGTLVLIITCLVIVMSPALTQSSFPLFSNTSNTTDEEIPEPTPASTPTPGPSPTITPTPSSTPTLPNITSFAPDSSVYNTEGASRTFEIATDQTVNVSWLLNGTEVLTDESVTESSYTNTSPSVGTWNVSATTTNVNGTVMQRWIWTVSPVITPTPGPSPSPTPSPTPTQSLDSNTTSLTPFYIFGYVSNENGSACTAPFVVITNLNTGEELTTDNMTGELFYQLITRSSFVNASDVLRIEASKDGTPVGNYTYTVTQGDLSQGVVVVDINTGMPDLVISEYGISIPPLLLENETNVINVTVWNNGTNASAAFNVSFSVRRETEPEYEEQKRVSRLNRGLYVNLNFSWIPTTEGIYNISIFADSCDEINELNESNNNFTTSVFVGVPDFTVTSISFKPPEPVIGDIIKINATIANLGTDGEASVSVYDNKSIKIERRPDEYLKSPINDTITIPDVLKIRVHFDFFDVPSDGYIEIYNKSQLKIQELKGENASYWTDWCDGDSIRIESWNAEFFVDGYEVLLNESSISLDAKNFTNVSATWNLSLQEIGWATSGMHNITVKVDPYNLVVESDEENNNKTEPICVNPSVDFAVTNISLNLSKPVLDDVVGIKANISNHGVRNGTTFVEVYYDNTTIEILKEVHRTIMSESEQYTSTDIISLPPGVLGARLYFESLRVFNGYVDICDKNGQVVERFYGRGAADDPISVWTGWVYSDNITVRTVLPYNPKMATHWCYFTIDKYEALIANETVTLNASESKVINATWRTGVAYGGASDHNITVSVDPNNVFAENDETNNNLSEPVFVNGTDLAVTNIDIPYSLEDPLYRTKVVNITATIANLGAADASNFTVNFSYGYGQANTSGVVFNTTNISFLGTGNFTDVITPWRIPETAELNYGTITVSIPFVPLIDNNKTNNLAYKNTCFVISQYDFSVENISVYPQEVREGEPVNITVTIGNLGITSGNVCVGFYVNHTDFAMGDERFRRIGTSEPVYVEPGGTDTTSFTWIASVHGGSHFMFAVADPDDEFEETSKTGDDACNETHTSEGGTIYFKGDVCDTGNNVRNCTLHVIRPDFTLTNLSLDPAAPASGDLVNITAKVKNFNETEQANSTVWFYIQSNESISGSSIDSVSGERPWNWSSVLQPEDVPIRFHFDRITIRRGGRVEAFINDSHGQRQPMYFYVKSEEAGGQLLKMPVIEYTTLGYTEHDHGTSNYYRQWNDVWTNWTVGTAVEIKAMAEGLGYIPYAKVTPSIDKYQVRLGNKTITVNANESRVYNATWDTRFPLAPGKNYTVFANVEDQMVRKETYLGVDLPDLTVTGFISPSREDMNASVNIKNTGIKNATNVTVRFELSKYREIEVKGKRGYKQITKEGAANIRVHFDWLDARGGWLEIKRNWSDEEPVKRYSEETYSGWSSWVEGDAIWIFCNLEQEYIIDAWEWGEIVDTTIKTLNASESVPVHIPPQWCEEKNYEQPRNLRVSVDPDNIIAELEGGNNNRTGVMYIDLVAEDLTFVSPDESHLCVHVEKNKIRATIKNNNETDGIVFPAGGDKRNFNVALEVSDLNGTVMYRHTENSNAGNSTVLFEFLHADRTLYAGEEVHVTFREGKIYPDFVGGTKSYKVSVIADSKNNIIEANEFYPYGEANNETSKTVTVYHLGSYTGGDLDTVTQGKVYGDMIYSIGNSGYDDCGDVSFNDINAQIPDNANITLARLYLYWFFWNYWRFASVDMHFNGEPVSRVRRYSDDTVATRFATRWGTYVYDVTAEVKDVFAHGGNYEASAQIYDADAHCTGMGLLIVYEDKSKPLIEYGIAEGALTMMADNLNYPTGLLPEQCTANASFAGVENNAEVSKAELLTVLPSWKVENLWTPGAVGDALLFNGQEVGTPRGRSYWKYEGDRCMALTSNHWEDVTDYLNSTQNKAEIQSRGNFMFVTNAFFKITYLSNKTFDTGQSKNPYPSISGIHEGTILLNNTITVNKLYTYPCPGTGGHTEYVKIYNGSGTIAEENWTGYAGGGEYYNITFPQEFELYKGEKYNYTIITGSYPQIIHEQNHTTSNGYISCYSFVDANGFVHEDWIPAIRLFSS